MELTQEHFDQAIAGLATKVDNAETEKRIIKRIDEAQEELARMVQHGFEDVLERLDVRAQVQRHEKALEEISKKLGLSFEL